MATNAGLIRLGQAPRLGTYLRAMWARREFATAVPLGQLRAQNFDTLLGATWHLLNPLFLAGVYYLVFGLMLNTRRGTENFIAFLTIGVFVFYFTSKCLTTGATSITRNMGLIRSINFPRAILPLSSVFGEVIAFLPAIAVMLVIAVVTGESPHLTWLLLLPAFALQFLFNLGGAFILARMSDHFLDVQQFLPYIIRIWMYVSGVFYAVDTYIENPIYNALLKSNPALVYITLARDAILDNSVSSWQNWVLAVIWALVPLAFGFWFFKAKERSYGRG